MKITLCEIRRCELKCNFCISSKYQNICYGKVFSIDSFKSIVDKLIKNGYNEFDLTPQIGDILESPYVMKMLDYLEDSKHVISYGFSTNLIYFPMKFIEFIKKSKKFYLDISLYGWDCDSYTSITNTDKFERFYSNIKKLLSNNLIYNKVNIYNRTKFSYKWIPNSKIKNFLNSILKKGTSIIDESKSYNWGGYLKIGEQINKKGICKKLIEGLGVFPNGDVTLCGCWDTYGEMIFANIFKDCKIKNQVYYHILNNQEKNIYSGLCKKCNDFESIR